MADRFPGGVISKTPPTVVAPVDGEGGSASGVWTLDEVLGYEKATAWPKKTLPRELYAWGDNAQGSIGDNTVVARSSPVQIGALTNWSKVAAGNGPSFAIKRDGTLWAWGNNTQGKLGLNDTTDRSSPVQVGALTNWQDVSTRSEHCGAIKTDGTLWMWGNGGTGRLGDETTANKSSPVQIGALTSWAQVSAGSYHTLAITDSGNLYAWGGNSDGQLGQNNVVSTSSPVQVGALNNWAQASAGDDFSTSIKTDGSIWSWGGNGSGQLGINTQGNYQKRSSPVQIGALTDWAQVSAGGLQASAVKTDGTFWAWGSNNVGKLGDGNNSVNRSSPVQIGALTNWSQVSVGNTFVAAIKTDNTLWAWGDNSPNGQLGDGTTVDKSSPVQVGSLTNWSTVDSGFVHTLAVTVG
jgi:alpha-tubulin suppressor-like RCC1 family protein